MGRAAANTHAQREVAIPMALSARVDWRLTRRQSNKMLLDLYISVRVRDSCSDQPADTTSCSNCASVTHVSESSTTWGSDDGLQASLTDALRHGTGTKDDGAGSTVNAQGPSLGVPSGDGFYNAEIPAAGLAASADGLAEARPLPEAAAGWGGTGTKANRKKKGRRPPAGQASSTTSGTSRVSWHPNTRRGNARHGAAAGKRAASRSSKVAAHAIDLDIVGTTHRAYADAKDAVRNRKKPAPPPPKADTPFDKDKWAAEQAALTRELNLLYKPKPAAGEYVPKPRKTQRAKQRPRQPNAALPIGLRQHGSASYA